MLSVTPLRTAFSLERVLVVLAGAKIYLPTYPPSHIHTHKPRPPHTPEEFVASHFSSGPEMSSTVAFASLSFSAVKTAINPLKPNIEIN